MYEGWSGSLGKHLSGPCCNTTKAGIKEYVYSLYTKIVKVLIEAGEPVARLLDKFRVAIVGNQIGIALFYVRGTMARKIHIEGCILANIGWKILLEISLQPGLGCIAID